ncbi:MAG: cytochrome C [Acidobacteria bacterium]|nr:cytochrome C [Acidobacteriota bacterium]
MGEARAAQLALVVAGLVMMTAACGRLDSPADPSAPKERLGKLLFHDETLSANANQSCATCHAPEVGWTGPVEHINMAGGVYEGSIAGQFSDRRPNSAAYATPAPTFHLADAAEGLFVGGNFWDGRATGELLGNPAADQALAPFVNPVEQALPDPRAVVERVCGGPYGNLFREVWGDDACIAANTQKAFGYIGLSIAEYEGSAEVNQFSSKYDAYLGGRVQLTDQEMRGLQLFEGKGRCADCHPSRPGPDGAPPLFTDFTFDNIGVPPNPDNPFYADPRNTQGRSWEDQGLGGFLAQTEVFKPYAAGQMGKQRVPTLRNVDLRPSPDFVKCYGHNCYFKSLEAFVHFYNTRLVLPVCAEAAQRAGIECWPPPEVAENVNTEELGDLGLSAADEDAIVAFMATLSDGYRPADRR